MKSYAFFLGCSIPARVNHYEASSRMVLKEFGVDLLDIELFSCCGPVPLRSISFEMFLTVGARNLALAEAEGLDIMCLCSGCFSTLSDVNHQLREDSELRKDINKKLEPTGLAYGGKIAVKHFLNVLHQDVGIGKIKKGIVRPYKDLRIATHYGCHTVRPSKIVQSSTIPPLFFDELVEATGAKSVEWSAKASCCGGPVLGADEQLAMDLCEKKIANAKAWKADFLCTSCPFCQVQFDSIQAKIATDRGNAYGLPSILYPQLLGLAMDMDTDLLGIDNNRISLDSIDTFF